MNDALTDNNVGQLWFRIARLRPLLRDHISIHRQEYRGEIWYVYQDHANNRFHRFDYLAHLFISLMDGIRCVNEIWELLKSDQEKQAPTQEDIFFLLGKLHKLDLLQSNLNPDTQELYQRAEEHKQKSWKMFIRNPVSFRVSLFDPEKLLTYALPSVKPLFSLVGLICWTIILLIAAIFAMSYWNELASNSLDQMLQPGNLALLAITYPLIKLLHELGHAFAVKRWGGEVHEIGIIFVLLIPIPYVDASAASAFTRKYQRVVVGAAGILVEIFLACIALFVWLSVEPGLVSTLAFNVMFITSVSTLFFNGNPLLRYDGYYVLSDIIGIPNLSTRSHRYIGYLIQHYLFDIHDVASPVHEPGERYWFMFYSPAAFIYRLFILSVIIMLVADQWFILGALLGAWIYYVQVLQPLLKHVKFVFTHPKTSHNRSRAILTSFAMTIIFTGFIFALPFPLVTVAQGIIWPPDNAKIHVGTDGFVKNIFVETGRQVEKGEKLILLEDPLHQSKLKILKSKLEELRAQYNASWSSNHVQSKIISEQILFVQAEIDQAEKQNNSLIISSPMSGKVIIPNSTDLKGHYFKQGDFIAYIIPPNETSARIVIKQEDMGLLETINNVDVAFLDSISNPTPASISRIIPDTNRQLPNAALGTKGGGNIIIDSNDETGLSSIDKLQHIEIDLIPNKNDMNNAEKYIGKRIYVRFEHGSASLAQQWYKSLQQLFLRRFSI